MFNLVRCVEKKGLTLRRVVWVFDVRHEAYAQARLLNREEVADDVWYEVEAA